MKMKASLSMKREEWERITKGCNIALVRKEARRFLSSSSSHRQSIWPPSVRDECLKGLPPLASSC